jgi:hypothetical protein
MRSKAFCYACLAGLLCKKRSKAGKPKAVKQSKAGMQLCLACFACNSGLRSKNKVIATLGMQAAGLHFLLRFYPPELLSKRSNESLRSKKSKISKKTKPSLLAFFAFISGYATPPLLAIASLRSKKRSNSLRSKASKGGVA